MRNTGGIIRLFAASAVSLAIIIYSLNGLLFNDGAEIIQAVSQPETVTPLPTEQTVSEAPEEQTVQQDTPVQTEPPVSVPAASSGTALGKVIQKRILPSSQDSSYNGAYLRNSSGLDVDIKQLLSEPLSYTITKNAEPQVLIMHTHTTECFLDSDRDYYTGGDLSRTTDNTKNMARIGDIVAEKLNSAGITSLHDTTAHDYPEYSGSYTRAAKTIRSYLAEYPSIKIVIDLHRDSVASGESDKVKLVTEINGKKASQIMLVMGSQSGTVKSFPEWRQNLRLALRLQQTLEVMYPSLARPLSLKSAAYNESLTTGSMLIEVGTDANALAESEYAGELLGNALVSLLNTIQSK